MKKDMHYYGTFAMARAAGVEVESAQIIASAAQYVDEAAKPLEIELKDGNCLITFPTAHHMKDIKNIEVNDQRQVWVPFHFLPGGEGNNFSERMVCRKDSKIAQAMVAHHLAHVDCMFGRELMGVAAHVYADTFAHYGFSGYSSRINRVQGDSIDVDIEDPEVKKNILEKLTTFLSQNESLYPNFRRKFITGAAENLSGGLGHGAVATYPDLPFLWWCFDYEISGETSGRRNDETFLEGCRALHKMFSDYLQVAPQFKDPAGGMAFEDIEVAVQNILSVEKDTAGRSEAWRIAMWRGELTPQAKQDLPEYQEDGWTEELLSYSEGADSAGLCKSSPYLFYQATSFHRNYVLRELLPQNDLMVI